MSDEMTTYGAVKLKDGIFFGDETAACDLDFIIANKVSGIINCCGREVPNHFQSLGVEYLTYNWADNDSQIILDIRNIVVSDAVDFIDGSLEVGESVLIHSFRGRSRCITLMTAYLMQKYSWSLNKALEFVSSRRKNLQINPSFHRQLVSFERRLCITGTVLSHNWDNPPRFSWSSDELVLYNTFMNSNRAGKSRQRSIDVGLFREFDKPKNRQRLEWRDKCADDRSRLEQLSYSTGKVYLGSHGIALKSILKKPDMMSPSVVSTAATTPQQSASRPSTPSRRHVEISPGTRPASPMPLRTGPGPPISLNRGPATNYSLPSPQVSRINSGLASFNTNVSGPVRVGRTTTPTDSPGISSTNFPSRISNHYVRPPSPMVSHSRALARQPSPAPERSQIRPPSPARLRPAPVGLSFNNETTQACATRPGVPPPAVKSMVTASGYRRSQSPMVASLPGVRNHSWRMR